MGIARRAVWYGSQDSQHLLRDGTTVGDACVEANTMKIAARKVAKFVKVTSRRRAAGGPGEPHI